MKKKIRDPVFVEREVLHPYNLSFRISTTMRIV